MEFPDSPRVIYSINPLDQVICQLRFPAILRIDSQSPYEFQDQIRNAFPLYSEGKDLSPDIPVEILDQLSRETVVNFPSSFNNRMNYHFESVDKIWMVNLTNNFIALSAKKYDRWENFRSHLAMILEPFQRIYQPAFFSRIGLRYIDIINRSKFQLENNKWTDLIQPYILGVISSDHIKSDDIKNSLSTDEILLDNNQGLVRLLHGFATEKSSGNIVYFIDSDSFCESQAEVQNVFSKLDYFNQNGWRLFRWCITDLLHNAMQPKSL